MRKQNGLAHIAILLVVLILAAVGFGGYYVWHKHNKASISTTTTQSTTFKEASHGLLRFTGTVTKIDLSLMPGDGPGYYTVKAPNHSPDVITLSSGESSCDRTAIQVPTNVHVGDDVSVAAIVTPGSSANVICTKGTYIKLKQSFLYIKEWGVRVSLSNAHSYTYIVEREYEDPSLGTVNRIQINSQNCKNGGGEILQRTTKKPINSNAYPSVTLLNGYYYASVAGGEECFSPGFAKELKAESIDKRVTALN